MKKVVQQLVVLGTGEVRLPQGTGEVAHGHRSPDQHISIVMPPRRSTSSSCRSRWRISTPRYNGQGSTTSVKPMNRPAIR